VATDTPRKRSTRDRPAKPPLSERAVIDAGLAILRTEGMDALSMRRIAKALDTGPASLYVYVANRDELLRLLFDEVVATIPLEAPDPSRWREQLRALCVATLEAFDAHPGIARVAMAVVPTGPNTMAVAENMMGLLLAGGIDPRRAAWAIDTLSLIVTANAVETVISQERHKAGEPDAYDAEMLQGMFTSLPPERYPNLVRHASALVGGGSRERFLFAIDTFVDGLVGGPGPGALH
jgi:AcrR family transcriptional regulator